MRTIVIVAILIPHLLGTSVFAQEKKGWMDIQECPPKHPGPWIKTNDSPEQAQLRKELANAGKIAFSSNRDGNWEIYVTNADGSGQKNLTNHPGWDIYPRWTPDGKILFFSDRDSKEKLSRIWTQMMEGPPSGYGAWSFRALAWPFSGRDVEGLDVMPYCGVYLMDGDGGNVKLLVKEARRANISPDGKWLTFERRGKTVTRDLATGQEFDSVQRYFGLSCWPEFSPDGKRILVASMGDTRGQSPAPSNLMATIFDLKSDGRPSGTLWNVNFGGMTLCPRWRPEGSAILITQGARHLHLQEVDLREKPNEQGWLDGKTIGLGAPADKYIHAFPAYAPKSKHVAFSLSPVHFNIREQVAPLGYRPWRDGNQIIWQELCVGHAEAGKDNVWIPLTDGGFANRDADWFTSR